MRENLEELRKQFAAMIRDERQAFRRLKDVAHKYRAVFQYLSTRSKALEEKLNHLISYRDEAKSSFDSAQLSLRLARAKVKRASGKLQELKKTGEALVSQYNALLEGRLPSPMVDESDAGADIKTKKDHFLARLNERFADLDTRISETNVRIERLEQVHAKLFDQAEHLAERAKMEETRLALFNSNIREILLEMNAEEGNVQRLAEDYSKLERLMKSAPDVSDWGMKVFMESVKADLPQGASILELGDKAAGPDRPN